MFRWVYILSVVGTVQLALGQQPTNSAPATPPAKTAPVVRVVPPHSPQIRAIPSSPSTATRAAVLPAYRPIAEGMLAWNGVTQEASVKFGSAQSFMKFSVTNISDETIIVSNVRTSCGCTVPKLPPMPWTLEPGTNGNIDVTMNLAGKRGTVTKTVTVTTDHGFKTLYVKTQIAEAAPGSMGATDRTRNLRIASANRQAVFQGECATCHATPALNKMGADLYTMACGICHEAEHRASMVPDLKNLQKETNADYWRMWATTSAEGKLMPAFALEHGGILNSMQIDSLVKYLVEDFPPGQASVPSPVPH